MTKDPRAEALSALVRFQVTDTTVGDTLQHIADLSVRTVGGAESAGMTMLDEDMRPTTAVFTDETAPKIDEAQYDQRKGPCLDAWRENRVIVLQRVTDHREAYPGFVEACESHGVLSSLSLPLAAGDTALGALNLYARRLEAFSAEDEALAADLAGAAGAVLANVTAYWSAFELTQQLSQALESRALIDQAKGILMARTPGLTPDGAFDLLRQASQRENVKLREIARRIVERRDELTD